MKTRALLVAFGLFAAATALGHPPVTVIVDARGHAYYSDLKQVWKVAPDGTKSVAVPNVHTHELHLDPHGNLFGEHLWYEGERTDKWGHYVWRRSANGRIEKVIPDREGFLENYSFVRDDAGNMYFADEQRKRVIKRSPRGTNAVLASNLKNIRWMTASGDGTVHLIDDNSKLVRITPKGEARVVAKDLDAMGLWTDRAGNVYAALYRCDVVKRFSPDGEVAIVARSSGIWSPAGGAIAPNGDLLLLEWSVTNEARLRRIR